MLPIPVREILQVLPLEAALAPTVHLPWPGLVVKGEDQHACMLHSLRRRDVSGGAVGRTGDVGRLLRRLGMRATAANRS